MAQRSSFALDVLSVCMIVFGLLFTSTINAANSVINYTTSNGTIVVPQGNFYNSSGNQVSLCSSTASTLKYDEEITKIGSYAFHNCTELTSITIPNTVTDIEYFAFSNCKKLSTPVFNSPPRKFQLFLFYSCRHYKNSFSSFPQLHQTAIGINTCGRGIH